MEFSHELALSLIKSRVAFPVDFEDAWQWLRYSTKQKAKSKLLKNFEPEIDYIVLLNHKVKQTGRGGHNREPLKLSVDCLNSLGMMAGTSPRYP